MAWTSSRPSRTETSRSSVADRSGMMRAKPLMTTLRSDIEATNQSSETLQSRSTIDDEAETDFLPAIEPDQSIELEKRIPFPHHLDGMAALRRHWIRVWKWF